MQLSLLANEITPATVLGALQRRIGSANGTSASALAQEITGRLAAADERRLRQVIEQLRNDGHPICAHPSAGYYTASTPADLDKTCAFLVGRAMTTLRQVSAMKHVALPDLYGQLGLPIPTEDQHTQGTNRAHDIDRRRENAPDRECAGAGLSSYQPPGG